MKNYDKSLVEVWKWKKEVYKEVKSLTVKECVKKLRDDADKILSESDIELTPISLKKEHQKIA